MQVNGPHQQPSEHFQSPEAVRLLWEGTRKALDRGIDHDDLVSLCDIIVRLADHRLSVAQFQGDSSSAESQKVIEQLQYYRQLASDLFQWATKPAPEPDWAAIAERLASVGAAPLELESQPKEDRAPGGSAALGHRRCIHCGPP